MKRLARDIEQKLLAILRDSGKSFDEEQACWNFAGIIERVHMLDQDGNRPGIRRPWGTLRILAHEAAQTYHAHTDEVLGRTTKGGRGARFVMVLADAAGITDPSTGKPYTIQKTASAVKETQKGLNSKAALNTLPKFMKGNEGTLCNSDVEAKRNDPARDTARGALLAPHVVGYEDIEGNCVADPSDGFAVLGGYQPAPNRSTFTSLAPEDVDMSIIKYDFRPPLGDSYEQFPSEFNTDSLVFFHGTALKHYDAITQHGFKPMKELSSVSYARTSSLALKYACDAMENDPLGGCIFAVRFESINNPRIRSEQFGLHIDDPNCQPDIIGYCVVPPEFTFI